MLSAVEGGRLFSSSASGYSSGLTLLLLGQKKEERPMRVSLWNQYQLVEQYLDPDISLAPSKDLVSPGCAPFICFGRVSRGFDGNSPPKVGPAQQTDSLTSVSLDEKRNGYITTDVEDVNGRKVYLKSSLKKNTSDHAQEVLGGAVVTAIIDEENTNDPGCIDMRKVQWTDACGRDLVEVREFELSDEGSSDEEFEHDGNRRCECVIQ